nr:hypothetical protein BgiMline_026117 [Biomphalaria glabrata]
MQFGTFIFAVNCMLWSASWTAVIRPGLTRIEDVFNSDCVSPRRQTIIATGDPQSTIASFSDDHLSPNLTSERSECDVWTIKSEAEREEIIFVIVNSLHLGAESQFLIFAEVPDEALRYDYNITKQDSEHFPKTIKSLSPVILVWIQSPVVETSNESSKQRLAFTYWTRETKSLIEEKENVVLMGAIVISIFTVIATLLSLTRATKCHCIKNSWTRLQARKRDRYSNGRNTRNNRSARSHPGETLTLMTVNVTNDNTTSSSLGVQTNQFPHCRSENGTEHGSSEVSVPGQENTDVASQSVMRSEATTSISLTTNESNDLQRTTESDTVNGQLSEVAHCPTMSALIGLLPPVYDPSTPMPSSLTLFTSLLPSRWRMHRSSSVFMTSATETPTRPACLTSITASGGEPMARSSTSRQSLSPQTDRAPYLQSSNTYHARSPTSAGSDSFPDSPPPYVDLSPPNYSTLFPSHT